MKGSENEEKTPENKPTCMFCWGDFNADLNIILNKLARKASNACTVLKPLAKARSRP